MESRDRYAENRDVVIAGSISSFGLIEGGEGGRSVHRHAHRRSEITEQQARYNLREQAECLADAGVDFLLLECTGSMAHRHWMYQECASVGLPIWLGFRCRLDQHDETPRIGYESSFAFADGVAEFSNEDIDCMVIFHSTIDATTAGVKELSQLWKGTMAVYPESDRSDYTLPHRDESVKSNISPAQFPDIANQWIKQGVQVIGGCCGINLEYINGLKQKLESHITR
jgi:S-methylmethionine-dependent homocysteine/selenocysteine methylase